MILPIEIHWPTFFLALGFFALISSLVNLLAAYIRKGRAEKEARLADEKLEHLKRQLEERGQELEKLIGEKK